MEVKDALLIGRGKKQKGRNMEKKSLFLELYNIPNNSTLLIFFNYFILARMNKKI